MCKEFLAFLACLGICQVPANLVFQQNLTLAGTRNLCMYVGHYEMLRGAIVPICSTDILVFSNQYRLTYKIFGLHRDQSLSKPSLFQYTRELLYNKCRYTTLLNLTSEFDYNSSSSILSLSVSHIIPHIAHIPQTYKYKGNGLCWENKFLGKL